MNRKSQLPARYMKAIELNLDGLSHPEIAAEMGFKRNTVWGWFERDDVRTALEEARRSRLLKTRNRLAEVAPRALQVLVDIISDEDASLETRRKAACNLLDRAGVVAPQQHEVSGPAGAPVPVAHLTFEQLQALADECDDGGGDGDVPRGEVIDEQ